MISILHISDLHIVEGAEWNNMRAAFFNEVYKKVHNLHDGEKLVIITGDFHNFSDDTYQKAEEFLKALFEKMEIDPAQDACMVRINSGK